jgi:hypothetical protein
MIDRELTAQDLEFLAARGVTASGARRQLEFLRSPPAPPPIVRPCTPGDGIQRLDAADHPTLLALWRQAAREGRIGKFVPASGAATRMFADLAAPPADGAPSAAAREAFARRHEFAFARALEATLGPAERDDMEATIRALIEPAGLGYQDLPKALIPFHDYADGPRTALVEQLVEAAGYCTAAPGTAIRAHFTIAEPHREVAADLVATTRPALEKRLGAPLEVTFSTQDPASDTLAIDSTGAPVRGRDGEVLLRPSGHGALLANLHALGGDIVVVKNIDNIVPEHRQPTVVRWKRLLIGALVRLEQQLAGLAGRLDGDGPKAQEAARELAALLAMEVTAPDLPTWARQRLRRPLRVCGMVRNTGEPGGGPFWVRGTQELATPQIVETAQIDRSDPAQEAAWRAATHFNPVDLVCSVRDRAGQPYDLPAFVDPKTAFVSRKDAEGRDILALERPGLWNGAMAGWNTLFIEVPAETFAPVKTVLDLLRPEHLPPGSA